MSEINIIDNNIGFENSNFSFDKNVSNIFDSHVRKSVPMYDEFQNIITSLSDWFVKNNTNIYDIGCSTGETINNICKEHSNKSINIIGIDSSIDMVNKSTERFKENKNIDILKGDVYDDNIHINNSSLITSILTMQFIDQDKREDIVKKYYKGLNKGGALILVEKVLGEYPITESIFNEIYHNFKTNKGFSEKEIFCKSRAIRGVMQPLTLSENVSILNRVGFNKIEIFFKYANFCGILAIK